jgi:hypothetical protein
MESSLKFSKLAGFYLWATVSVVCNLIPTLTKNVYSEATVNFILSGIALPKMLLELFRQILSRFFHTAWLEIPSCFPRPAFDMHGHD